MDLTKIRKSIQRRFVNVSTAAGSSNEYFDDEQELSPIDDIGVIKSATQPPSKKLQSRSLPTHNPAYKQDVLAAIDAMYWSAEKSEMPDFEFKKFIGKQFDIEKIDAECKKLKEQHLVVSEKVTALIRENHPSYAAQLQNVLIVQDELFDTCRTCRSVRKKLGEAQQLVSDIGLRILVSYNRTRQLQKLICSLQTIKMLHETDFQLRQLIEEGNFPAAIRLCMEASKAASTYNHFTCIGELSTKLSKTLIEIETELDRALATTTMHFDSDRYSLVHSGYSIIGKLNIAATKLVSFFHATIENSARTVLINRLMASASNTINVDSLSYEQLCEQVPSVCFTECLREIGFILIKLLTTYHHILRYHIDENERLASVNEDNSVNTIIEETMRKSMYHIFRTASNQFNALLCSHDLTAFKFDNFLDIVQMAESLKLFGRKYFGNSSNEIWLTIEKHTLHYFTRYHRDRLDELRMFLESEAWAQCPVNADFSLFDLQEFYFLKRTNMQDDDAMPTDASDTAIDTELGEQLNYVLIGYDMANPFISRPSTTVVSDHLPSEESIDSEMDDTGPSSARSDDSDRLTSHKTSDTSSIILCNTALNLLRFFGRYMHMANLLPSVGYEAVVALIELYDYFLYSICSFFCSNLRKNSSNLNAVINRIESSLIANSRTNDDDANRRIAAAQISIVVQLNYPDCLFALAERIVGVESLVFLASQLNVIRPVLESLLPTSKRAVCQKFYEQTVPMAVEVRRCAYGAVASRALNYEHLLQLVVGTKWDIVELMSQHSVYVDFLVQEFETFSRRLTQVSMSVPVPNDVYDVIWKDVIFYSNKTLVQGYGEMGKRCSSEGRALMQLDLQQMIGKLEQIVRLRPIPHKAYVENYIKAYYLPEAALEQWIMTHREYSPSQLTTLLHVATHVSKKTRTRLLSMLEERLIGGVGGE